jgi:predicted Zn-dependent protease
MSRNLSDRSVFSARIDRPASRFLSREECAALAKRAASFANGGGTTRIQIASTWTGNIRYARNTIISSGDVRDHGVQVFRDINGAFGLMLSNRIDDVGLEATVRRAEHLLRLRAESGGTEFQEHMMLPPDRKLDSREEAQKFISEEDRRAALHALVQTEEPFDKPHVFYDSTYNLNAEQRSAVVEPLIAAAKSAGMVAAGYIEVSATGLAVIDTVGKSLYYPVTSAQFSVTVRNPKGTGSGWAGVDWNDWNRIDTKRISEIAIDKCIRSANPVAVEPGRYTAVLEPQAVADLCKFLMVYLDRVLAESGTGPFAATPGRSKIGQKIFDERISIGADPMDPELGIAPFSNSGNVYHPVMWVKNGVLRELAYYRPYGIKQLGKNTGLPNSGAFRMSGGTASIEEMISTTRRGVLVTRFSDVTELDSKSMLLHGYTRDGLWLIENGKISKAIKNFRFMDSPMFILNKIEALGVPTRVFHPKAGIIVPPMKVHDFHFSSLSEAI